jgi:hypothetical protein
MSFFDPLLGVTACGIKVTHLGVIDSGTEVPAALASER